MTELARIGRFVVLRKLGEGAMGVVFVAYDEELDRKLAVKLVLPALRADQAARGQARLLREAQALARVSDPHVVHVYEVGSDHGGVYVAMELVRGRTFAEWLRAAPRRWREIVAVGIQIGRGLAAAHAAGVVHRDVKPDNALVGDDGRARVLDFSLARPDLEGGEGEGQVEVDATRTQAGQLVGTPVYMSPEQLLGRPADARSDQFSLCVTLYEALYGVRPFAGGTVDELRRSVGTGSVEAPRGRGLLGSRASGLRSQSRTARPGSVVSEETGPRRQAEVEPLGPAPIDAPPAWLRRVLLRGLATDPAARYPDVPALLAELDRDPGRRWRRVGLGVGLAAASAGLGLAWTSATRAREGACAVGAARLAGVWDADRRAAAEATILGGGLPFAATSWSGVAATLDAYASAWAAARDDACAAAELRGAQSPAVQARRYACLDARLRDLDALVDVLVEGRAEAVQNAVASAAALPSLAPCDDEVRLLAGVEAPAEAIAAAVAAVRADLAAAQARVRAGDLQAGRAAAEAARTAAAALDYPPLHAEAELACGRAAAALSRGKDAARELEAAYHLATRLGHEEVASAAALELVANARALARFEVAETWARIAEDGLVRAGSPPLLEALWLRERAMLAEARGAEAEALPLIEASLARFADAGDAARAEQVQALNALGLIQRDLDRPGEAIATFERGLELATRVLGEDHPAAVPLLNNRAGVLSGQGRFEEALVEYRRGLAIRGRVYGEEHPRYAFSLAQIAEVQSSQGRYAEAIAGLERALAIRERTLGPDHPQTAETRLGLGKAYFRVDRADDALRVTEEARRSFVAALGEDHPQVASAEMNLAVISRDRGDHERALALDDAAIAKLLRERPRDHPTVQGLRGNRALVLSDLGRHAEAVAEYEALIAEIAARGDREAEANALQALAEIHLGRGAPAEAIPLVERARVLLVGQEDREFTLAKLEFLLGRARWAADRGRAEARRLVEETAARLRAAGPDAKSLVAELDAWLADPSAASRPKPPRGK